MRGSDWNPDDLRAFVDKIANHHDAGRLPFALHLPGGNEEQLIKIFSKIKENDYVLSTHRNMYHALLHGLPPEEIENKIISFTSGDGTSELKATEESVNAENDEQQAN